MGCCGIKEYRGIRSRYKTDIVQFGDSILNEAFDARWGIGDNLELKYGMLIFSDAVYGKQDTMITIDTLEKFLNEINVGEVIVSQLFYNPNSGNFVKTLTWIPAWDKVSAYKKLKEIAVTPIEKPKPIVARTVVKEYQNGVLIRREKLHRPPSRGIGSTGSA